MSLVYTIGKIGRRYKSTGDQNLTVSGSSVALTVPTGTTRGFVLIQDNNVHVSFDGTAAATTNLPLPVGTCWISWTETTTMPYLVHSDLFVQEAAMGQPTLFILTNANSR